MPEFTHLHVHSQYSILDGAASIPALIQKVKSTGMNALALTDHGTMLGIKEFHATCLSNNVKPILGCEAYVARRGMYEKSQPVDRSGYHLILLAKNYKGYKNLMKMMSIANLEGFYMKPRIDNNLLEKYHEGLIVSSACLGGEIAKHIANGDIEEAEKKILWFKGIFGDDFYLEVMHHPTTNERLKRNVSDVQLQVNDKIFELAAKHDVKVIATNDSHFTNKEDAEAHDVLICLTTNADINEPNRLRYTQSEWFKTPEEMQEIFPDHPETLANTMEIADKIEIYKIDKAPIMPEFPIPEDFGTEDIWREKFDEASLIEEFGEERFNKLGGFKPVLRIKFESDYLEHLVEMGSRERYGENYSAEIQERLDFELNTIKTMGFPGYFLIVQDFIAAGRKMGVLIGKGRGSAAGSAVAYCTKITDVDPIAFDLLFERFLNPDRISMPDVDIDFDDDGRALVVDYVTKKYGSDKVAHICTIGTMKAKGALRDVARVLGVPLNQINDFTKKLPLNGSLSNAYKIILEDKAKFITYDKIYAEYEKETKKAYKEENDKLALKLETRKIIAEQIEEAEKNDDTTMLKTIDIACTLEGSARQTGVHACGMLIGRDKLENNIPLMRTKEGNLASTQYEGKYVEDIGLLKMDFLGLKTLSIIKECLLNIKLSKGIDLDIESVPLDDDKTLDIFRRGATTSIFQFESDGMKTHLKNLKPSHFNDLVAMNALYRPGPMEYIPDYIRRKLGKEETTYDHPIMKTYLKDTYGITVFQEQVMLQSRALGNFTRGESDSLRKAMGKKKIKEMEKLHVKFVDGCLDNPEFMKGCVEIKKDPKELIEKIWKDWSSFAKYAFNKSHSVCYAYIAYQTAYLKAHFPAEFMAANMTRNISDMDKISIQMAECRRMKMQVLSPDVNESYKGFTVNKEGNIRFGMAGIKSVGSNAVENIIEVRDQEGQFKDIFDFVSRVNLNSVNKKNIEALAFAGALDCFKQVQRPQYFTACNDNDTFIEALIKFGNNVQSSKNSGLTLFGEMQSMEISNPEIPELPDYDMLKFLNAEKEHIGMYVSGHPLEPFKYIITNMNIRNLRELDNEANEVVNRDFRVVGFITEVSERMTKNGKPFGRISMIDYTGSFTFTLFGKDYTDNKNLFVKGYSVMITAIYKEGYTDKTKRFFNVTKVSLLSDIKENYFKKITLSLPVENVTPDFIGGISELIKNNKGKININFKLFSCENKTTINLFSRTERVSLSDDIIDFLENNNNIVKVSLN